MASRPLVLAAFALALLNVPSAFAQAECLQAHPWSEVCHAVGDVVEHVVPPGEACLPDPAAACQLPLPRETPPCPPEPSGLCAFAKVMAGAAFGYAAMVQACHAHGVPPYQCGPLAPHNGCAQAIPQSFVCVVRDAVHAHTGL